MKTLINYCLFSTLLLINGSTFGQVFTEVDNMYASGGISVDSLGNIFVADFGDFLSIGDGHTNNVWKVTPEGAVTVYASGFGSASGNAFNSNGILYQADIATSEIYKIEDGIPVLFTSTNVVNPVGLVFDEEDNLFICNCGGNTIAKADTEGATVLFSTSPLLNCPNGITIDPDQNLYISNFSDGRVIKIDTLGNASLLATIPGANNGHLKYCPADSNLYVCSHGSSSVYKVSLDGDVSLFAGTGVRGNTDGAPFESTFSRPNGVGFSLGGDTLYLNSTIPVEDSPGIPLNPSKLRSIRGVKSGVASVHDIELSYVRLGAYPNPSVSGEVMITGLEEVKELLIHDLQGKEIFRVPVRDVAQQSLQLEAGTYLITGILNDGGMTATLTVSVVEE